MMRHVWDFLTNPLIRKWLYGVSSAATLVLGTYGVLDEQEIAAWNMFAAAVFLIAALNTDTTTSAGKHAKVDEDDLSV